MKTNRFDEILRRKLESTEPDFQDQDWDKWAAFRQHASPTFWQTYGHWVGYTVATLTTVVMVVLYINQSNQNQDLLKEMQALKQQIITRNEADRVALDSASTGGLNSDEVPLTKPSGLLRPDTVYIVERQTVYLERPARAEITRNSKDTRVLQQTGDIPVASEKENIVENPLRKEPIQPPAVTVLPKNEAAPFEKSNVPGGESSQATSPAANLPVLENRHGSATLKKPIDATNNQGRVPEAGTGTLPSATIPYASERIDLGEIAALPTPSYTRPTTDAYRRLQSRLPRSSKAVSGHRLARSDNNAVANQKMEEPPSVEKVEKVAQDERLLPTFGLGLPYRVGVGQQWEGRTKSFGLWNEVLLGQHWSVQAGLGWLKLEDQKFYNDRVFRDKTHEDFRKQHAKPLPQSFDIFNITVATTLLRVPLNLTYRSELSRNFALFAGAGTHLNLRAKQKLSFDFKRPTNDFGQHMAERTVAVPLINNMNVLLGAEKRWSPIVLQASAFLNTRLKASPYLTNRTNIGLQVKILYELGAAKKK